RHQDRSVLARIDEGFARAGSARDNIRDTVPVRVAGGFDSNSKLVAGTAVSAPNQLSRLHRVNVNSPRHLSRSAASGNRCHELAHAIAIHIADFARDASELIIR